MYKIFNELSLLSVVEFCSVEAQPINMHMFQDDGILWSTQGRLLLGRLPLGIFDVSLTRRSVSVDAKRTSITKRFTLFKSLRPFCNDLSVSLCGLPEMKSRNAYVH